MSFAQSLDALAQAANETKVQEPPKKRRKHVHAASSHNRPDNELATDVSALSRSRSQSPSASGSDDDVDVDVDVPVGYAVPERILDERVFCGLKQYRITWLNLPESKDSWELASEYDDGAYNGAYLELVEEWEEYKLTDPQYAAPTTTPPHAQVQATNPTNKRKSARKCS